MAKSNDFLKNLQGMDPATLRATVARLTSSLTPEQQKKLTELLSDPERLRAAQSKLSQKDVDLVAEQLRAGRSPEELLRRGDVKKRLDELL